MKHLLRVSLLTVSLICRVQAADPEHPNSSLSLTQSSITESVASGQEQIILTATRDLQLEIFRIGSLPEKEIKWSGITYGMAHGVRTHAATNEVYISGLNFRISEKKHYVDRGPEWQAIRTRHHLPLLDYVIDFPPVHVGDILPLTNGMLFRVVSLDDAQDQAVIEPVSADEVPGAPAVSENCRILLIGGGTLLGANYDPIQVDDRHQKRNVLNQETQIEEDRDVVQIQLFRWPPQQGILSKSRKEMAIVIDIVIGSTIQVGGVEYTVRNIVLPDPKRQVIGWVELEMPPFDEAREAKAWKEEQEMWRERWGPVRTP